MSSKSLLNKIIAGKRERFHVQEPTALLVNKLLHILQIREPVGDKRFNNKKPLQS
uniref:Cl45039_-2a n=1 Tax=Arundo donax TaxID=35708 RepID=A0A0A9D628_ARUDO